MSLLELDNCFETFKKNKRQFDVQVKVVGNEEFIFEANDHLPRKFVIVKDRVEIRLENSLSEELNQVGGFGHDISNF